MGYDIAITRRRNRWDENDTAEITNSEWAEIVASDPELEMVGHPAIEPSYDGGKLMYRALRGEPIAPSESTFAQSTIAQLATHPHIDTHGAWLCLRDGEIVVKNPDEPLLTRMCAIADRLGAWVQGQDGEYYQSDGRVRDGDTYLAPWRRLTNHAAETDEDG